MPSQVTEKSDAYMDNLRVGLELWDKQLSLGGEVDSWAGAKLALFAESHPFHNQQHVSEMKVRVSQNCGRVFWKCSNFLDWLLLCRRRSAKMRITLSASTKSLWRSSRCCRVRRPLWSCRSVRRCCHHDVCVPHSCLLLDVLLR